MSVFVKFPLKYALVEVEVELLVRCIDTQLLEAVYAGVLKTGNIQNTNRRRRGPAIR